MMEDYIDVGFGVMIKVNKYTRTSLTIRNNLAKLEEEYFTNDRR